MAVLNNPWINFSILLIGLVIVTKIVAKGLVSLLKKIAAKTKNQTDDIIIARTENPLVYVVGLIFVNWAARYMIIDPLVIKIANSLIILLIAYLIAVAIDILIEISIKSGKNKHSLDNQMITLFRRTLHVTFLGVAIIYVLKSWNVDIVPIVGSLGILGIAIAFAMQETLKNLIGGISLILDKNINIGDLVQLRGGESGTVYQMSMRSTKVKTFDNKLLIIPNNILANDVITNIAKTDRSRRVQVDFDVAYGSDPDYVKKIVLEEIEKVEKAEKTPAPNVVFREMGASGLHFECRFWVKERGDFIIAREGATLKIYERLMKEKINIPFPQTTVWLHDMSKMKEEPYRKKKTK
jgi:MscS family membrane protein